MRHPKAYEVQVRLRLRVLAADEDEATAVVSADVADRLGAVLDSVHATNPQLAGWCLQADELVDDAD